MNKFAKTAVASAVSLAVAQAAYAGTGPYFTPLTKAEIVDIADGFKVPELEEGMQPILDTDGNPVVNSDGEILMEGNGVFTSTGRYVQLRSVDELNTPWAAPAGVTFRNLMSMEEVETDETGEKGTVVRVDNSRNSSMFDMLAFDPSGENIFIPHETTFGSGVSRYNIASDRTDIIFKGDESWATEGDVAFNENRDFGAFDPVRWTPNGTLIAGEEWSGTGRFVEICDPYSTPADPNAPALNQGNCETDPSADWRVLDNLPLSAQEGIVFSLKDPQGTIYFIDEDNTGSVYKSVFVNKGEYNKAQTFVLSVDSFKECVDREESPCDPSANWNSSVNRDAERTGWATWVPITDENGDPIPGIQDPSENLLRDDGRIIDAGWAGRLAADQVHGTPFGRPEDATITLTPTGKRKWMPKKVETKWGTKNKNVPVDGGNEMWFFTATSENAVYSVEETEYGPYVRLFASSETPRNLDFKETDAVLNSPDNLAIDALGNIFIIEDSPNTTQIGASGGDVWFARDMDSDGVAESLDHFLSLQVPGSESTGMIFNPVDPTKFVIAIQHPESTRLSDQDNLIDSSPEDSDGVRSSAGAGDAIWEFDLTHVQPPICPEVDGGKGYKGWSYNETTGQWVSSCSKKQGFNVIEELIATEDPTDFPTP